MLYPRGSFAATPINAKPSFPRPPAQPPRGGIIGPVPPSQPMPPWTGVYPPGTIQNYQPLSRSQLAMGLARALGHLLSASWDETGRPGQPPAPMPPSPGGR
jgi:hypothetical protein